MFSSIADGLRAAGKQPKLVALLWAWYLLLSLVPGLPGWSWLRSGLDGTPAADVALRRFDFGLFGDLMNYNQANVFAVLTSAMFAAGLVAFVTSAFAMGGTLEVLGKDDDRRSFMHRFFRGGGHFFWRFFRLAVLAGVSLIVSVAIVSSVAGALTSSLSDTEWEPGGYLAGLIVALAAAVVAALFLLALDYARVRVARDDSRKMLRAYLSALGFVLRHLLTTYGIGLGIVIVLVAVMGLYVAYETNSPVASTWGLLAMLVVLQQLAVAARVFLRVSLVGGERAYFLRTVPPMAAIAGLGAGGTIPTMPAPPAEAQPARQEEASVDSGTPPA